MSAFTLLFVENTWEITVAHLQSWHSREKRINEHQLFTVFRKSFLRYVTQIQNPADELVVYIWSPWKTKYSFLHVPPGRSTSLPQPCLEEKLVKEKTSNDSAKDYCDCFLQWISHCASVRVTNIIQRFILLLSMNLISLYCKAGHNLANCVQLVYCFCCC